MKQIISSYAYYLILKLSITASLYGGRVYIGMYVPDCMISDNKFIFTVCYADYSVIIGCTYSCTYNVTYLCGFMTITNEALHWN